MTITQTMPARRSRRPRRAAAEIDTAWDAARLRAVWERVDPDPTQVAAAVGVTTETLRRWRLGRFVPDVLEIRLLATALGARVDDLLPPE